MDLMRRRLDLDERPIALEEKHAKTQEEQTEALVNVLLNIISKNQVEARFGKLGKC